MHKTVGEATEMVRKLDELVADSPVEVVICAPFTSLASCLGRLNKVKLGAQNMYFAEQGAFTGRSPQPCWKMLAVNM